MAELFKYLDYRKFLADNFKGSAGLKIRLSRRRTGSRMGVAIEDVISGKRNLRIREAVRLCGLLKLNASETAYFKNLLLFDSAKSEKEKNDLSERLLASKKRGLRYLDNEQLSFFSDWFIVPVRELLGFYDFNGDYAALGRLLFPPIGSRDARKAVSALKKLSLIEKDEHGIYRPIHKTLSTGDEVYSFFVTRFQCTMIDLAKAAIEKVKPQDRDISGLTLSISTEQFGRIKKEIGGFRKKILRIAAGDPSPDRVIRCNFQIFPLTQHNEKRRGRR